jgi:hypothetical protein
MNRISMLATIALAIGMVVGPLGVAHAGTIYLREGNNATEDVVGVLYDWEAAVINFKEVRGFVNDEARSLEMEWVLPGTRIVLFDSPSGSTDDDWAEIVVKKMAPYILVRSFNYSSDTDHMSVTYHSAPAVWYRNENGLDGKVSRAEVIRSSMVPVGDTVLRMYSNWEERYSGFPHKGGEALEYSTNGSNYRIYRPDVSSNGSGFLISFKVDHIRGEAADDHAIIAARLDDVGSLQNISTVVLKGDDMWFHVFVDVLSEIPEEYKTNKYVVIAEAALRSADKVYQKLLDLAEAGGREIFKSQIEHKTNEVLSDALQAIGVSIPRGRILVQ